MHECPECGEPMEHVEEELDVGIVGHWFCGNCEIAVDDLDDYADDHEMWRQ
jgi:hypothetical protein